jgi:hypothetical protein
LFDLNAFNPGLFTEILLLRLRAPESALDSGFYTKIAGSFGRTHG